MRRRATGLACPKTAEYNGNRKLLKGKKKTPGLLAPKQLEHPEVFVRTSTWLLYHGLIVIWIVQITVYRDGDGDHLLSNLPRITEAIRPAHPQSNRQQR